MSAVADNGPARRYELEHAAGPSFARYRDDQGVRVIEHVETPTSARGQGHAARLMQGLVAHARANGLKLTPRCGYARAWFARHREAADVLA